MDHRPRGIDRILIVHPDADSRRAVDAALRRVVDHPFTLFEASSLSEGLQACRQLDPRIVLLDLGDDPGLTLEVARELRRPDRLVVGLYDPLVARGSELDFLRDAVRAGVGDFVPLPVADDELAAAVAGLEAARSGAGTSEGRTVSFCSHKGGVGTTTLAVNAALVAAEARAATATGGPTGVALCDTALQLGDAAALLGLAPDRDLLDLIRDLDRLVALPTYLAEESRTGLRVLAGPRDPIAAEAVEPEELSRALIELRRRFGLVVLDVPSRLDALTLAVLDLSETIVVVTEAVAPTIAASARFLALLASLGFGGERVRVVVNRHAAFEGNLPEEAVAERLGQPVDLVVPFDDAVVVAAHRGVPAVFGKTKSGFAKAIEELAGRLVAAAGREPRREGRRP